MVDEATCRGTEVDPDAEEVRVELQTPLQVGLLLAAGLAGLLVILLPCWELPLWTALVALVACLALVAVYRSTDCCYVLDNHRRRLEYERTFLGMTTRTPVCRFDELHALAGAGYERRSKHSVSWEYELRVVLRDGSNFRISDRVLDDPELVNGVGTALAASLGVPFEEARAGHALRISAEPGTGKVTIEFGPTDEGPGISVVTVGVLVSMAVIFIVMVLARR